MRYLDRTAEMNVAYAGFDFLVRYDYTPEEPAEHYGDAPYPGAPEQLDIVEVLINGEDISPLLSESTMDDLIEKVLEMRGDYVE